MLDHIGEALGIFVEAWRFLLSRTYRARKLAEWREALPTASGKALVAGEILAALALGVLAPLWVIVLLM